MRVFKFGGASVKDADGIRNLGTIVSKQQGELVVVVSALGKTTNALEEIFRCWMEEELGYKRLFKKLHNFHNDIIEKLFPTDNWAQKKIDISFGLLDEYLGSDLRTDWDREYDQIVSFGEVWSTIIVSEYLAFIGVEAGWVDIRQILVTDDNYRDANILWHESTMRVKKAFDFKKKKIFVAQGFIGGTVTGDSTTLGREGSDYTAAVLANMLDAECATVWKDVPGLLNADPKWMADAKKLDEVSYKEAVEMTFSGAKVIHPKTIKPLHNKNIPLFVKSFLAPEEQGTMVSAAPVLKKIIPIFTRKEDLILVSIVPKDFSFAMGNNLGMVFQLLNNHGIKVSLVQASAVNINICAEDDREKIDYLRDDLRDSFNIYYNEGVEMITIRHYTASALERIAKGREILLEQKTRNSVRIVVRSLADKTRELGK